MDISRTTRLLRILNGTRLLLMLLQFLIIFIIHFPYDVVESFMTSTTTHLPITTTSQLANRRCEVMNLHIERRIVMFHVANHHQDCYNNNNILHRGSNCRPGFGIHSGRIRPLRTMNGDTTSNNDNDKSDHDNERSSISYYTNDNKENNQSNQMDEQEVDQDDDNNVLNHNNDIENNDIENNDDDSEFLQRELQHIQSLEAILRELEEYELELLEEQIISDEWNDNDYDDNDDDDVDDDDSNDILIWNEASINEILGDVTGGDDYEDEEDMDDDDDDDDDINNPLGNGNWDDELSETYLTLSSIKYRKAIDEQNIPSNVRDISSQVLIDLKNETATVTNNQQRTMISNSSNIKPIPTKAIIGSMNKKKISSSLDGIARLEFELLQGVVPVSAGVGSYGLPGDFGFDPFHLADKDLFLSTQQRIISLFPDNNKDKKSLFPNSDNNKNTMLSSNSSAISSSTSSLRPKALILRDYREAEIRHGRLAMIAAIIWPLQEMLDRLLLVNMYGGPLLLQTITLPYFPLLMTLILLLLGYLDIYSQSIKEQDMLGEAFLPGDCFWDPLQILQPGSKTYNRMVRNMQERELFNGRAAMLAIGAYLIEEFIAGKAIIDIPSNALLFEPIYQIPFIQRWLDIQFSDTVMIDHNTNPSEILDYFDLDVIGQNL